MTEASNHRPTVRCILRTPLSPENPHLVQVQGGVWPQNLHTHASENHNHCTCTKLWIVYVWYSCGRISGEPCYVLLFLRFLWHLSFSAGLVLAPSLSHQQ